MAKFTKIGIIPLILLLFFTVQASAEYTTNKAEFMAEYPGLKLQDFADSKVPVGEGRKCMNPLDTLSNDDCVSPGVIHPGISFNIGAPPGLRLEMRGAGFGGALNTNTALVSLSTDRDFIIRFDESNPVNVVGLDIGCLSKIDFPHCNNGPFEVRVIGFGEGNVIGGFEITASDAFDSFLGISNNQPIARIIISPNDPNEDFGLFGGVDAVYFGLVPKNVPTISEWGMIATVAGLGIIGFIVLNRRKKAYN